jgi:hypothetical protein
MLRWTNRLSRIPFTDEITGSSPVRSTNDKVGSKTRPKSEVMKYIFRGHTVFEYKPDDKFDKVVQGQIHGAIPAFDFCKMIDEDYKLLGEFFNTVYRHTQGEDVPLEDIEVY